MGRRRIHRKHALTGAESVEWLVRHFCRFDDPNAVARDPLKALATAVLLQAVKDLVRARRRNDTTPTETGLRALTAFFHSPTLQLLLDAAEIDTPRDRIRQRLGLTGAPA